MQVDLYNSHKTVFVLCCSLFFDVKKGIIFSFSQVDGSVEHEAGPVGYSLCEFLSVL